ncbi:MAG: DEAD/DEAH box helicase, partial [Candidatus Krumholzibacteria bacterium]|nr:DEAD/DEAH box helicase [Candidatus Krumholzibacteria bacterium]
MTLDVKRFLGKITVDDLYDGQIVHSHKIPLRNARFGELGEPLPAILAALLASSGVEHLYTHQVEAVEALRSGTDTVIVTSTASGKTLCYNIPVLESLIEDPESRALYLYPTKALAQDQLRV